MCLLFNGTKASAVLQTIALTGKNNSSATVIKELPSVDYVRKCSRGIKVIATTIASCVLVKNNNLLKLFSMMQAEDKPQ